jgi:hypothetical protein
MNPSRAIGKRPAPHTSDQAMIDDSDQKRRDEQRLR